MTAPHTAATQARAGWSASLELEFAPDITARTCLARRAHTGPLVVQRPFYPDGPVCHAYVVHPPGGLVGGDTLTLSIHARAGSHALVTTPAATKVYRSAQYEAIQSQHIELEQAAFEWLPQETIIFPDASARLSTRVRLCERSRFIGWEVACLGRPASGLAFTQGRVAQDFELWIGDAPRVIDRLRLNGAAEPMRAAFGLSGQPVLATLMAYPADDAMLDEIRAAVVPEIPFAGTCVDGAIVCRAVGAHADRVRAVMESVWRCLRPHVMGRAAVAPRIWST